MSPIADITTERDPQIALSSVLASRAAGGRPEREVAPPVVGQPMLRPFLTVTELMCLISVILLKLC